MLKSLESTEGVAYIGLALAIFGIISLAATIGVSAVALFFAPLIMVFTVVALIPYSLLTILFGWVGRKQHPFIGWFSVIVGLLLTPTAVAFTILFGEVVGRATQ